LDLHLPGTPGEEVLHQLKVDEDTDEIPVVVISADATATAVKRLLGSGASDYLTKPLDIKRFLEVVDKTLNGVDMSMEPSLG
jgi:CheY-like chemotaxis protein